MFENAELGVEVSKKEWDAQAPRLRQELLATQSELAASPYSCVVLVSGVEGAGKTETVNLFLEWMDARGIAAHAMRDPTTEESERPEMWRFWRRLPKAGRMGIFLGTWYTHPIVDRTFRRISAADLDLRLDRIAALEEVLARENTILVKLWMHLSKKAQKQRLHKLERDELTRFRVTKRDWKFFDRYDRFREVSEHVLRRTGTGEAPWTIVEAADPAFRSLTAARALQAAIRARLSAVPARASKMKKLISTMAKPPAGEPSPLPRKSVLSEIDFTRKLDPRIYDRKLAVLQSRLGVLTRALGKRERSVRLVFEGPDAAGTGGAIRRITGAMDAGLYDVHSVAAPTDEERGHPYLWRFWRNLPPLGKVAIFDRSWYGRVLVERVEGFAAEADWRRAYAEINSFEEQLIDAGILVRKFWLAITPEEQLRRFESRLETPYKQYKITREDWRNRAKWNAYQAAAVEMIEKTSATDAPWIVVEANDKQYGRVKVLKEVVRALE